MPAGDNRGLAQADAKLWNADTGELLWTLEGGHTHSIEALAFSPDGSKLATASLDRTVGLWDVATGEFLRTVAARQRTAWAASNPSVAWSPNGTRLAVGTKDEAPMLWDVNTGALLRTLSRRFMNVKAVAVDFSPDGATLATGHYHDNSVKLWDVRTGNLKWTSSVHSQAVTSVRFSPDGLMLATGSADRIAKIWTLAPGTLQPIGWRELRGHDHYVHSVAFNNDGTILATASEDKKVILWNVQTAMRGMNARMHTLSAHTEPVRDVAFSPDGSTLATASEDGKVMLWEIWGDVTLLRTL
jgi:WD40 repeat protein